MKKFIFSFLFLLFIFSAFCESKNAILQGGSGRTKLQNPTEITKKNGKDFAKIVFNSKNYDYIIVDNCKFLNENKGGFSTFTIPVLDFTKPIEIRANTLAMSVPHEIEYTILFENIAQKNKFSYATEFSIEDFENCKVIKIKNGDNFLVVPQNSSVPKNAPKNFKILKQPLNKTYLVSTSVADLICKIGATNNIRFSGTKEKDWFISDIKNAMQNKKILFSGKYSSPDYELLLSQNCNFSIQNTMIYHKPQVKEKLEELEIPVLVERSIYESNPLGRLEWVKLYGILFDKEKEAKEFFENQIKQIEPILKQQKTNKSVAFFFINSNGIVNVRKSGDYISKMIEMAGGKYALENLKAEEENSLSTMNMQIEDFYLSAVDCDILIYNGNIGNEITKISDLTKKSPIFNDFKAVKNKKVYCTGKNFFQETSCFAEFIKDLNKILNNDEKNLVYIKKVL